MKIVSGGFHSCGDSGTQACLSLFSFSFELFILYWGIADPVAQRLKHLPRMRETRVQSLGQEDPLEKEMATCSVFLPGESHGRRSLVDYSPQGRE